MSVENWSRGAKWLADYIRVVPMDGDGLLRLGTSRTSDAFMLPHPWRPPQQRT